MDDGDTRIEQARAALAPHGLFVRGVVHFDADGPVLGNGRRAGTVVLVGNVGGSTWNAFAEWRRAQSELFADPLDRWSEQVIRPVAAQLGGTAYFPSEKPWHPFQQWAMRAEGLRPSPLGILIHPQYGLWHGYRGAIGFVERIGEATLPFGDHPCEGCADKPCLTTCPVDAVYPASFDVAACRSYLRGEAGMASCRSSGCIARNACPVGVEHRYPEAQLHFHMAALNLP